MPIPSILEVGTPLQGNTTGETINIPAAQPGEFLVALLSKSRGDADITTIPTGWTLERKHWYSSFCGLHILTRIADGTEGASISVGTSISARWNSVCLRTNASGYRGDGASWGNNNPWVCPSFDTIADDSAALRICCARLDDAYTKDDVAMPEGDFVLEEFIAYNDQGNYLGIVKTDHPTAGATGDVNFVPPVAQPCAPITIELLAAAAAGPSIDDVDGDGIVVDGQTGATVSLSGFTGTPTLKLKHGAFETAPLSYTGDETGGTFDVIDHTALTDQTDDFVGVPVGQTVKLVAKNGTEVAEFDIVIQPKAGWDVVTAVSASTGKGSLTDDPVSDDSVALFSTANNTEIASNLVIKTDVMPINAVLWNSDTGIVEVVTASLQLAPDAEDPTIPENVVAESTGATTGSVTCDPASDNVGVTGYRFFLDGVSKGTSATPNFTFEGLTPGQTYVVTVAAYDAAANESDQSVGDSFTTDAAPAVPVIAYLELMGGSPSNSEKFRRKRSPNRYENADQSKVFPIQ